MKVEGNIEMAKKAVTSLMPSFDGPVMVEEVSMELQQAEKDLLESVHTLKDRNHIRGEIPSLDDILDPAIEREDADSEETDNFADGEKGLEQIVNYVQKKQSGETEEKEEEEEEPQFKLDWKEALATVHFFWMFAPIAEIWSVHYH